MLQGERASSLCRSQYLKSSSKSHSRNYVLSIRRVRFPRLSTHCIPLSFALYDAGTTSSFSKESGTLLNEQSGVDAHYVIDQESLSWALERPEAELPDKFIKFIKSKSMNQDDILQAYDFFKKNDASVSNDRDLLNATWNETRNTGFVSQMFSDLISHIMANNSTNEMLADLFTKPLEAEQFIYLRDKILS